MAKPSRLFLGFLSACRPMVLVSNLRQVGAVKAPASLVLAAAGYLMLVSSLSVLAGEGEGFLDNLETFASAPLMWMFIYALWANHLQAMARGWR